MGNKNKKLKERIKKFNQQNKVETKSEFLRRFGYLTGFLTLFFIVSVGIDWYHDGEIQELKNGILLLVLLFVKLLIRLLKNTFNF